MRHQMNERNIIVKRKKNLYTVVGGDANNGQLAVSKDNNDSFFNSFLAKKNKAYPINGYL